MRSSLKQNCVTPGARRVARECLPYHPLCCRREMRSTLNFIFYTSKLHFIPPCPTRSRSDILEGNLPASIRNSSAHAATLCTRYRSGRRKSDQQAAYILARVLFSLEMTNFGYYVGSNKVVSCEYVLFDPQHSSRTRSDEQKAVASRMSSNTRSVYPIRLRIASQ